MKRKIIFICILLILISSVYATGIRPAKTELAFDETKYINKTIWAINNDYNGLDLSISVQGEIAEYVNLHTTKLTIRDDEDAKPINFEISLPPSIPPGISTAYIVVEEKSIHGEGSSVSSRILLKHKIIVEGPYPEKYVKAKVNFRDTGDTIMFVSEVENFGTKDLENVYTNFYVNDKLSKQQKPSTEGTSLKTNENKLLTTSLPKTLFDLGEYEVSAVTHFDGQQVELLKKLRVGKPDVDVTYFDKYFQAYELNRYAMDLLNKWNREIKNVFVDVEVQKDEKKVDSFRTKSVDLPAEVLKRIEDYLDGREKSPGVYTFKLIVNFWNDIRMEQKEFLFDSEFLEPGIELPERNALSGAATQTELNGTSFSWLPWIIITLLLLLITSYVVYRYINREEYERGGDVF